MTAENDEIGGWTSDALFQYRLVSVCVCVCGARKIDDVSVELLRHISQEPLLMRCIPRGDGFCFQFANVNNKTKIYIEKRAVLMYVEDGDDKN